MSEEISLETTLFDRIDNSNKFIEGLRSQNTQPDISNRSKPRADISKTKTKDIAAKNTGYQGTIENAILSQFLENFED